MIKFLTYFLLFFAVVAFAAEARKGGHHHDVTNVTEVTNITNENSTGVASALALGQCQFDYTYSIQGCSGLGFHDGNSAISFGMAKRVDEVLLSGGLAYEDGGDISGAVGISWKFK